MALSATECLTMFAMLLVPEQKVLRISEQALPFFLVSIGSIMLFDTEPAADTLPFIVCSDAQ
jgi:hypothetical protein